MAKSSASVDQVFDVVRRLVNIAKVEFEHQPLLDEIKADISKLAGEAETEGDTGE
jgi:hypothetical protein